MIYTYKQTNLPIGVEMRCALRSIYGFGWYKSDLACIKIGLSYPYFINNLNFYNFNLLSCVLDCLSMSDIKILKFLQLRIMRHVELRTYKGIRYLSKLPVRGQRTRSNARSCRRNSILKF